MINLINNEGDNEDTSIPVRQDCSLTPQNVTIILTVTVAALTCAMIQCIFFSASRRMRELSRRIECRNVFMQRGPGILKPMVMRSAKRLFQYSRHVRRMNIAALSCWCSGRPRTDVPRQLDKNSISRTRRMLHFVNGRRVLCAREFVFNKLDDRWIAYDQYRRWENLEAN